jgi:hypothetical protein
MINESVLYGMLINITKPNSYIPTPWSKQHWFAIRRMEDTWWNLDSKIKEPNRIDDFRSYLRTLLEDSRTQVILITGPNVTKEQLYGTAETNIA